MCAVRQSVVRTIVVSNELIEINLGIDVVTVAIAEGGTEDVSIIDTNVLGGCSERHVERFNGQKGVDVIEGDKWKCGVKLR